jgi:hypothetical protein
MRPIVTAAVAVALVALVAGAASAFMGPMAGGIRGGGMGPGMMMGAGVGPMNCPGMSATSVAQTPITEEKARELAQQYADRHLAGFAVEKVLPFTMGHGMGFVVELKGPQDEMRTLHVNPRGNVMPFGPPWRRAG